MSLVPFAPVPAAPAAGHAVLSRPAAPRSQSPVGSPHAGPSRTHAAGAEPRSAGAAKGKGGFASVLDSVQQEAPTESSPGEASASASGLAERTSARDPRSEVAESDKVGTDQPADITAPVEERKTVAAPASSWLLLALEHGTFTRTDGADSEVPGEVTVAAAVLTAPVVDVGAGVTHAVPLAAPPGDTSAAGVAAGSGSGQLLASLPDAGAGLLATASPAPTVTTGPPAGTPVLPMEAGATEVGALPDGQEPGAPPAADAEAAPAVAPKDAPGEAASLATETASATTTVERPVAEALARWRAVRRQGADTPAEPLAGETPRPAAPGLAVSRLAQTLGRMAGEDAAPAVLPVLVVPPAEGSSGVATFEPTARASEVLLRLAQAGGPAPSRSHDAPPSGLVTGLTALVGDAGAGALPLSASSVPANAPLPPAVGEQVTSQIVSSLKMQWKDGIGEAKLHLRPDALGQVSVTLRVEQGAVTAVVKAESPQVQEWVLQHQQALRQQLQDAGLRLDELSVNPDGEQPNGGRQDTPDESGEQSSRRHPSRRPGDGPRFDQLL